MHNFVYLAQRRSQEFSCEPNFGGRAPRPPLAAPVVASAKALPQHVEPHAVQHVAQHVASPTEL